MKVNKIFCDRCGAEINGNPIKLYAEEVDRESGGFRERTYDESLENHDFCEKCVDEIIRFAKSKPENQPLSVGVEVTREEVADLIDFVKNQPLTIQPAEQPTVEIVKDSHHKTPTVQELILQGVPKKEVVEITGCKGSSYDQVKYTLKKKGLLPKQQKQDEPVQEAKTYQCSKVKHKCFYGVGNGVNRTCDYIGMTGHMRGCKPEECNKYKPLQKKAGD